MKFKRFLLFILLLSVFTREGWCFNILYCLFFADFGQIFWPISCHTFLYIKGKKPSRNRIMISAVQTCQHLSRWSNFSANMRFRYTPCPNFHISSFSFGWNAPHLNASHTLHNILIFSDIWLNCEMMDDRPASGILFTFLHVFRFFSPSSLLNWMRCLI